MALASARAAEILSQGSRRRSKSRSSAAPNGRPRARSSSVAARARVVGDHCERRMQAKYSCGKPFGDNVGHVSAGVGGNDAQNLVAVLRPAVRALHGASLTRARFVVIDEDRQALDAGENRKFGDLTSITER